MTVFTETEQLQNAFTAFVQPEHDLQVRADMAVNDIVISISTLVTMPHILGLREIEHIKLAIGQLDAYLSHTTVARA